MKNTKLITLLGSFNNSEIKKFREFVTSPFFNKNQNLIKLNDALTSFHPNYESNELTEELLFSKIFGDEIFDYFKIKNLTSDLYNLGLEYLKLQSNPGTEFMYDYNLMVQLRIRKLFNFHKKMVKSTEEKFTCTEIKDSNFLFSNYLLSSESQLVDLFEKPSSITGILNEFESFFEYLIYHLLQFYNLMIHIGKENKIGIDLKMMDEVVDYLEQGPVSKHPITTSYQYLLLLKVKKKEEYYFRLKDHYFNNFNIMDPFAAYRVHMHMFGYCADMYNFKGDRRFIYEGYELYKHSYLNKRVTSGELLYPDFVNFIKVFARAGDTELARNFMDDYSGLLPVDQLDNSLNFAKAYITQYEGNYAEALKYVSMVNFPLAILKVQARIMEVQLNYLLGYYEETRSIIELFKKSLIKETVLSEDYKDSIKSFLKYTVTLINLQQETNKKIQRSEAKRIYEVISHRQPNHFGTKFWLEDMLKKISSPAVK